MQCFETVVGGIFGLNHIRTIFDGSSINDVMSRGEVVCTPKDMYVLKKTINKEGGGQNYGRLLEQYEITKNSFKIEATLKMFMSV